MKKVFNIEDKNGKTIYLSEERLKHILKHPNMNKYIEEIKLTIKEPLTIRYFPDDEKVRYFYKEFKQNSFQEKYLLVSVKYLNGEGFIITSFLTNKIIGIKWNIT